MRNRRTRALLLALVCTIFAAVAVRVGTLTHEISVALDTVNWTPPTIN